MPVVNSSQMQGLVEITQGTLSDVDVADVLSEWRDCFNSISWLRVLDICRVPGATGRGSFAIVMSPDYLDTPFNLYAWVKSRSASGVELNPVTAISFINRMEGAPRGKKEEPRERAMKSGGSGYKPATVAVPDGGGTGYKPAPVAPPQVQTQVHPVVAESNWEDDEAPTGYFGELEEGQGEILYCQLQSVDDASQVVEVYEGRPIVVGRSRKLANFHLHDEGVSRVHAKLVFDKGRLYVSDLGSTNGTYVNGNRLESFSQYAVGRGDKVSFYKKEFRVL